MTSSPGPGMYGSDGTFIPYISEEEFTAMQFDTNDITPDRARQLMQQAALKGQAGTGTDHAAVYGREMAANAWLLRDAHDITPDPIRITWIQSGYATSGTLQEYADLWESREYGDADPDLHNGLSTHAVYWESDDKEPLRLPIHIVREHSYVDEDTDRCWIPVRFSLDIPGMPNGSVAMVNLDGDA